MTKFFIYPYSMGSESAKALRDKLEGKLVKLENSTYKYDKNSHILINWGSSSCPHKDALNYKVGDIIDKKRFFDRLKGKGITPQYATSLLSAVQTLTFPIFCRTKTTGRDGEGIVIADQPNQLVDCNLYVEGIAIKDEYRIHLGRLPDGQIKVIGAQKKIKLSTPSGPNVPSDPRIMTGDSVKFVWTVGGNPVAVPIDAMNAAEAAFKEFKELSFAAFDVIQSTGSKGYVLEANSAPMATPETTERYANFFQDCAKQLFPEPVATPAPVVLPQPVAATPSPAAPMPTVAQFLTDEVRRAESVADALQAIARHVENIERIVCVQQ